MSIEGDFMKNLKVYKKIGKRIAIISATMILGSSLAGCGNKKDSLLENTILEQARVITFEDGHVDIAILESYCFYDHPNYNSIITNEYFTTPECENKYTGYTLLKKENIINDESIVAYLTEEEIIKASKDKLTDDDITNIIARIIAKNEKEKTK